MTLKDIPLAIKSLISWVFLNATPGVNTPPLKDDDFILIIRTVELSSYLSGM